ncbi:MAG: hypothetical protein JNL87_14055 [Burkholderiaceae bacterium]|nr:hypothetical protein [Burkholderiaceae bacterium]
MRLPVGAGALAAALLLSACAEKAQTAGTKKSDSPPWQGAQGGDVAAGWKPGDKASWEEQLKTRSQGQNEYSRAPARP